MTNPTQSLNDTSQPADAQGVDDDTIAHVVSTALSKNVDFDDDEEWKLDELTVAICEAISPYLRPARREPVSGDVVERVADAIERIIFVRAMQKRLDGYTLETSHECAKAAIAAMQSVTGEGK